MSKHIVIVDIDEPVKEICDLVESLYFQGYAIIFCTGRRESCRDKTIQWIYTHFRSSVSNHYELLMRPNGDHRHDIEVKPELLKQAGIDLDDIAFVLEDIDLMVAKWRQLGLICLQVEE